jgi:tetratricopeptide (TPR) repeat protein
VYLDYLENVQENANMRRVLAYTYAALRQFDKALVEVEKAISLTPEDFRISSLRRAIFVFRGELEEARTESLRMLDSENTADKEAGLRGLLTITFLQGKFAEAVKLANQAINVSQSAGQRSFEVRFRERLIEIFFYLEEWDKALIQINEALPSAVERGSLVQQMRLLVARGKYLLNTGSLQEALKTADELKELIESGLNVKAMRYYNYLMGLIELERKKYSGAVKYLEKAQSQLRPERDSNDVQAKFYFALGQAQHKEGNLLEAQKTFEEITLMTFGRTYCQHFYALAFYEQGKVFEDQGDTTKAIEHYEKFLDLWKDADPGLAEVEDAKERLAGLKDP